MAINRFDRPGNYDWNYDTQIVQPFTPNFEAWDKVLGQYQTEKDAAGQAAALTPQAISKDTAGRDAYVADKQATIDKLTDMYASGDIQGARRLQSDFTRRVTRDHAPGGQAHGYESRVKQYKERVESLDKLYKDAPWYMKDAAMDIMNSSITEDAWKEGIADPNLGAYNDITADLDKYFKGWASDVKGWAQVNGAWIDTGTREVVTDAEIRRAGRQFLQNPKYAKQLGVEANLRGQGIDDATLFTQYSRGVNSSTQAQLDNLDNLSTRQLQKMAQAEGIDIGATGADGKNGKFTKAAKQELIDRIKAKGEEALGQFGRAGYLQGQVMSNYIEPFAEKHSKDKLRVSKKANQYYRDAINNAAAKDIALSTIEEIPEAGVTRFDAAKIDRENIKKDVSSARDSKTALGARYAETNLSKKGLVTAANAAFVLDAWDAAKDGTDKATFLARMKDYPNAKEIYKQLQPGTGTGSVESMRAYVNGTTSADREIAYGEEVLTSRQKKYIQTAEGSTAVSSTYSKIAKTEDGKAQLDKLGIDSAEKLKQYYYDVESGRRDAPERVLQKYSGKAGAKYTNQVADALSKFNKGVEANIPDRVDTGYALKDDEGSKTLTKEFRDFGGTTFDGEFTLNGKNVDIDESKVKVSIGRNGRIIAVGPTEDGEWAMADLKARGDHTKHFIAESVKHTIGQTINTDEQSGNSTNDQALIETAGNAYLYNGHPEWRGTRKTYTQESATDISYTTNGDRKVTSSATYVGGINAKNGFRTDMYALPNGTYIILEHIEGLGYDTANQSNSDRPMVYDRFEQAEDALGVKAGSAARDVEEPMYTPTPSKERTTYGRQ